MQPLNYCRQLRQAIERGEVISLDSAYMNGRDNGLPGDFEESLFISGDYIGDFVRQMDSSVKFILPNNAICSTDEKGRGLLGQKQIRQPYKTICLEYSHDIPKNERMRSSKRIVLASEIEHDGVTASILCAASYMDHFCKWFIEPRLALPHIIKEKSDSDNPAAGLDMKYIAFPVYPILNCMTEKEQHVVMDSAAKEVAAYYSFINVASCSNVEFTPASGCDRASMKKRRALGFDEYKVLMVSNHIRAKGEDRGGSHASPREHLRRGHIRRIDDGRRVWVNATVVCAGSAGRITKDYAIKGAK